MGLTKTFKAARVPARRYDHKFSGQRAAPKFRYRKRRFPKPKR